MCTLTRYLGCMGNFFSLFNWMFQLDCLDTCCFKCLTCMCSVFFVFAPVQRNGACFTWKGALEVRSLLLLLLLRRRRTN